MKKSLLLVLAALILVGCDFSSSPGPKENLGMTSSIKSSRFFTVYLDDTDYGFIVDKETRVQYLWHQPFATHEGFMSVFVDSLGKPILYEGDIPE